MSGYETLFKGPGDRRLRRALVIATSAEELRRHCAATLEALGDRATVIVVRELGYPPLGLPAEDELRAVLVERIREARPDVVISPDPTPMLRRHPDTRRVAQAALDAAWPYSGVVKEAWVYGGPAPDLFVDGPDGEERFAQVDFRERG